MENPTMSTAPINQDVMNLVANGGKSLGNPQVQKAINDMKKAMAEQGIDAQSLVKIGQLAEFALKNPKSYPMVMDQAIKAGLATPQDAQEKMNPKEFAGLVSAGKLAQMILDEGKSA